VQSKASYTVQIYEVFINSPTVAGSSEAIVYYKWAHRRERNWFAAQALQGADEETDLVRSDTVDKTYGSTPGSTSQVPVLTRE
jgi:hypothetical protein